MSDVIMVTLVSFVAVIMTIGVVLLGVVAVILWKLHAPVKAAAAALTSIVYFISSIDFIPEVPFGPIGLADDILILAAGAIYAGMSVARRRRAVASDSGYRALR